MDKAASIGGRNAVRRATRILGDMNQEEQARVVESYIASSRFVLDKENVLRRAEESEWASQALYRLADSDPALALKLCTSIAQIEGSDEMLERLANGPLLEVLKRADDTFLVEISQTAAEAAALRELLSYVWDDNELPGATWAVIRDSSAE
jgi:hypothetical protein